MVRNESMGSSKDISRLGGKRGDYDAAAETRPPGREKREINIVLFFVVFFFLSYKAELRCIFFITLSLPPCWQRGGNFPHVEKREAGNVGSRFILSLSLSLSLSLFLFLF